ncbi:TetR family transcriptional regulator [Geodermatophilus marinus]|uniref:TetR family transcriptional regulator n=1 Tax=Geodermatophilus sp. LHW52908 TaxID=2303986 RepID=UPI000E3CE86D|nr:TetR family transcriptional regulator [Geodermatophilus sp. LHW52908]RFU20191.1 TetR family transcriptional regulator [Geodermatophilus sp. LHW52908]
MGERSVREERRRGSRRALQAAALDLVGRRGFAAVTVDDIAAAAGVSRRTFFNHFPTKAAALFDPDPDDARRLADLLAAADGAGDPWAALAAVCREYLTAHTATLALRRRLAEDPELAAYQQAAYGHVGTALTAWVHRQRPDDPLAAALLAAAATGVLGAAFATWRPDDDPGGFLDLVGRGFALVSVAPG